MAVLNSSFSFRRACGRRRCAAGFAVLALLAGGWGRAVAQDAALPIGALKKLSVEELMDIEVTSVSRHPEKLLEAASAIQVITAEDIRRSGASRLPEALRLADNLEVAQKNSHDWGVAARGFNTDLANKLLVMIDGRTVYTPLFSGVFWDIQDYLLADLARIEVISGPGGTQWGANAVNGVINIISKSAKDTPGLYLEAGGGAELKDFAAVRYGATIAPKVYLRVYGKSFERAGGVLADGTATPTASKMQQGGFRLDSEAAPQATLTWQGDFYRGDEGAAAGGTARVSGGNLLGRWSQTLSGDSDLSLQLYYDRTHLSDPVAKNTLAPAGVLTDDLDTYDLDFQHRLRLAGRHRFMWGLGYRFTQDAVVDAPALAFRPERLDRRLFNGFVQDEIALEKNLSLTLGTKLEHNDYTGSEVEPSGRLQWKPVANRMLWAAVSRAVRTPSRIDRDLDEPTYLAPTLPQSLLRGGANFKAETVLAYELGYRAQFDAGVSASLATFYNVYDHLRSTSSSPPPAVFGLPFFFENNLEGETHGLEFSATWQPVERWRLRGGYDLLREHLHVKPGRSDLNHALNETSDPSQQFSLRSSVDLPHEVEFDAAWRWVDALHDNNNGTVGIVPAYCELDVRLGWRPAKSVELSLIGQNLLHDHHPEFGAPSPGREEIKRSVYGKATWRF